MNLPCHCYSNKQKQKYQKDLSIIASLSNLFSDSPAPMIYYRATENIYCASFGAKNISRTDCTADAIFQSKTGVGIKTFLDKNGGSFQKIAEFNKQSSFYRNLTDLALIRKISELRNIRIESTMRAYGLESLVYHCIVRGNDGMIQVFEKSMEPICISSIKLSSRHNGRYLFSDGKEQYEFYISKSTLFMHFSIESPFISFKARILTNPLDVLSSLENKISFNSLCGQVNQNMDNGHFAIIPLYSENKKRGKFVGERSGLNQWNGKPRVRYDKRDHHEISRKSRNKNDVYIPFNTNMQKTYPSFFPKKGVVWKTRLPDGSFLKMKICSGGKSGKGIESIPNHCLGEWLLRRVLQLPIGQVLTYDNLSSIGIDSLIFRKNKGYNEYECDFVNSDDELDLEN